MIQKKLRKHLLVKQSEGPTFSANLRRELYRAKKESGGVSCSSFFRFLDIENRSIGGWISLFIVFMAAVWILNHTLEHFGITPPFEERGPYQLRYSKWVMDFSLRLLTLPIHPLWWSLFASCGFAFSTLALQHGRSAGWVRSTTLTGFTATGTTRFAVDPAFTFITAKPLSETVTFCHFSCRQCCSFLHQLCGSGPYALICKQMFWALLVSPCGSRHHALVSSLLAFYS